MSIGELPDRPSFQPFGQEVDAETTRLSRLAVFSFVLGLLSLASFLSSFLLGLAALAIVLGLVSWITIHRDPAVEGATLAQLGAGLGVLAVVGSVTFYRDREIYLFQTAGSHAETFLNYLASEDNYYEALELLYSARDRQLSGTDLKAYYENASEEVKEGLQGFVNEEATKLVVASQGAADWQYQNGVSIRGTRDNRYIEVAVRNEAPGQGQVVHVTLQRLEGLLVEDDGAPTAHWNVYDIDLP